MAENTTDLDAVMQAAERQRRIKAGEHGSKVYEQDAWQPGQSVADLFKLADFALSILPKGKRPEPVPCEQIGDGQTFWMESDWKECVRSAVARDGYFHDGSWSEQIEGWDAYDSEAEAELALHWKKLDSLRATALATPPF